ncbi:hypothetical protein KY342_04730, partial [Candidatus Woesearchaeota archaeon]|nr:hypothetical protein [Candidatus Woesearchaeota archaeon]
KGEANIGNIAVEFEVNSASQVYANKGSIEYLCLCPDYCLSPGYPIKEETFSITSNVGDRTQKMDMILAEFKRQYNNQI